MDIESDGSEIPHIRYEGYSLQEKFDWLRGGSGADAAEQVRTALIGLATAMEESDRALRDALRPLGVDWQGVAAESLGTAGAATSAWVLAGGDAAQVGSGTIEAAGAGFATTRIRVEGPDLAGPPGRDATVDVFLGPVGAHTDLTVIAESERGRDDAANRSLYAYEETLREATKALPPLAPPPELAITISGSAADSTVSVELRSAAPPGATADAGQSLSAALRQADSSEEGNGPAASTFHVTAFGIDVAVELDQQIPADEPPTVAGQPLDEPPSIGSTNSPIEAATANGTPPPAQPNTGNPVGNTVATTGGLGVVNAPGYRIDSNLPTRDGAVLGRAGRGWTSTPPFDPNTRVRTDEGQFGTVPGDGRAPTIGTATGSPADVPGTSAEPQPQSAPQHTVASAAGLSAMTTGWDTGGGLAAIGGIPLPTGETDGWSGRRRTHRPATDSDERTEESWRFGADLPTTEAATGLDDHTLVAQRSSGGADTDRIDHDIRPHSGAVGPAADFHEEASRSTAVEPRPLGDDAMSSEQTSDSDGVRTVAPAVFGVDAPGYST